MPHDRFWTTGAVLRFDLQGPQLPPTTKSESIPGIKRIRDVLTTRRHPQLLLGPPAETPPLSRAQSAHWRLPWAEPLARNARAPTADSITIRLFGILAAFATSLGLATA